MQVNEYLFTTLSGLYLTLLTTNQLANKHYDDSNITQSFLAAISTFVQCCIFKDLFTWFYILSFMTHLSLLHAYKNF